MSNSNYAPTPVIWPLVVAVLGVFAIFLVIVGLARTPVTPISQAVNVPEDQQWRLSSEGRKDRLAELEATAQATLDDGSYAWINEGQGVVRLPYDRAQELVLAELKADQ